MDVDFGKTTQDYGTHRAGFPDAFFERLSLLILGQTASADVAASLPPEKVIQFDRELDHRLETQFPDNLPATPHRVFAVICEIP